MPNSVSYFALSAWFICVAWLLFKSSKFYQALLNGQEKTRFETLDGLRGFLALAVFIHHAVIYQHYFQTGNWEITKQYPLYHFAADFGVSLFFMITGFLFWTKVLTSEGKLNTTNFFKSRLNRLVPLYVFHVLVVLVLAFYVRDFHLWERPLILAKNVLSWLAFGILGAPDINQALDTRTFDAGVTWTLAYEWAFYVALPLLACFWRGRGFALIIFTIFSYGFLVPQITSITLFAFGMIAAYLVHNFVHHDFLKNRWFALSACLLMLLAYHVNIPLRHLLFFIFFLLVVYGNPIFGILTFISTKLLGTVSYSIYLLQGSVLFITLHLIDRYVSVSSMEPFAFLLATTLCGTLLIAISTLSYRFIEHPFLVRTHPPKPVPNIP